MKKHARSWFILVISSVISLNAFAVRENRTDRPDKTRTAYTIEQGHVQVESEIFSRGSNGDEKITSVLNSNIRNGISKNAELQLQLEPFVEKKNREAPFYQRGFGGLILRFKQNLRGNDDNKKIAISIMPVLTLPVSGAGIGTTTLRYGFIVPIDFVMAEGWRSGLMFQINQDQEPHNVKQTKYGGSYSVSHRFRKKFWGFVEYFFEKQDRRIQQTNSTVNLVLQYELNEKFNIDAGTFIGVTDAADKQTYFTGATYLF